jgi:hypothetical protein
VFIAATYRIGRAPQGLHARVLSSVLSVAVTTRLHGELSVRCTLQDGIDIARSEGMAILAVMGSIASVWRGQTVLMTSILAVYRSCPVMIVVETEEGVLLELSLNELADVYELLPPALWQELVHHYHIFRVV